MKSKFLVISAILGMLAMVASACAPGVSTPTPAGSPNQANFRFLVSDQPNDIGDFAHLNVTISSIGVQLASDNTSWLQFSPDIGTIDLTTLQGKNAEEIWSGNVTPGQYNKVFIYVSNVEGILAAGTANGTANVKLPSGKLQISTPFTVSDNNTTSLVFDITVIKAGKSGKYILKPQIAESGAGKEYSEVKPRQENQRDSNREQSQLKLRLEGDAQPGTDVILSVLEQGRPADGAAVSVNNQQVGTTDAEGKISLTIPTDVEEVEIKAVLGEKSGELKLEFGGEAAEG